MSELEIQWVPENQLARKEIESITRLRNACFPEHACDRSYFKQLPHARLLAFDDGILVGHAGVDLRMMAFDSAPRRVLGLIDLCVASNMRGNGVAGRLICEASQRGVDCSADFLLLMADDHRLYVRHGFACVDVVCQWLRIDEHKNLGVAAERISDELMLKPLVDAPLPRETVDFLGYMY